MKFECKYKFYECIATIFSSMNIISAGMQYGWPSPSLPTLLNTNNTETNYHISSSEGSSLAVANLIGAVIGSIFAGYLMNVIGRKTVIVLSSFPYFTSWIMIGFSKSFSTTCVARFIAGIADGLILVSVSIYIGEYSDSSRRGFLGSFAGVSFVFGIFLINVLGLYCSLSLTAFLASSAAIASFLGMIWMPESPYYFIMKKQHSKAKKSLSKFRGNDNIDDELEIIINAVEQQKASNQNFIELIKNRSDQKGLLIIFTLRTSQQLCGYSPITFYINYIFETSLKISYSEIATISYFLIQVVMCLLSLKLVDAVGRKLLLIISTVSTSFILLITAIFFHISYYFDTSSYDYIPVVFFLIYSMSFNIGLMTIPMLMLGELFSVNFKSYAACLAELSFILLAVVTSKFFQILKDSYGMYVPLYCFGLYCFFSTFLILYVVPETKQKSLEDIQEDLSSRNSRKCTVL